VKLESCSCFITVSVFISITIAVAVTVTVAISSYITTAGKGSIPAKTFAIGAELLIVTAKCFTNSF
jgi:hypothetical protein